jgi:hypothetical protein
MPELEARCSDQSGPLRIVGALAGVLLSLAVTPHRLVPPSIMAKVERVHVCEESGDWFVHGPKYFGGLGWLGATWNTYRAPSMPSRADLATPQEQAWAMWRFVRANGNWWPDQSGCTGSY